MILMNNDELIKNITLELKQQVKGYMIKPCLAVIQIGEDEISQSLINTHIEISDDIGIYLKHIRFSEDTREIEIINKIVELNNDDYVNGIILQLPVPEKFNKDKLINYIARNKDINSLTDLNLGKIFNNKKTYIPSIGQAILNICEYYNISLTDKHVLIVDDNSLLEKSLLGITVNQQCIVSVCHSDKEQLSDLLSMADIIITATNKPNFINETKLKKGVVVFDLGASFEENKIVGDITVSESSKKIEFYASRFNGVEKISSTMLMKNVIDSYKKMNEDK